MSAQRQLHIQIAQSFDRALQLRFRFHIAHGNLRALLHQPAGSGNPLAG